MCRQRLVIWERLFEPDIMIFSLAYAPLAALRIPAHANER